MGVKWEGKFKAPSLDLERILKQTLEDEKATMDKRITSGQGYKGQTLRGYTADYKRAKAKRGRQVTVVDMTLTGAMLRAITVTVKRAGSLLIGEISFSNAKEGLKARGNIARGREFFGFTKEQFQRIKDKLQRSIK